MTNPEEYGDHAAPVSSYPVLPSNAVEPKVKAATAGTAAGAVVSAFLIWLLDVIVWNGPDAPPEVPLPVVGIVGLAVTTLGAYTAGWRAKHVNRVE